MREQFQSFFMFYRNPRRASSMVLDHGSFLFGLLAAIVVTVGMTFAVEFAYAAQQIQWAAQHPEAAAFPEANTADPAVEDDAPNDPSAGFARAQWKATSAMQQVYATVGIKSLVEMAVIFIPIAIFILAAWDHLGSGTTILFRDYMPALTASLFAWAAAKLPFLILMWALVRRMDFWTPIALELAAAVVFVFLVSFALSTVTGATLGHSFVASLIGQAACLCCGWFLGSSSGLLYMFSSPWVLYYVYQTFGRDVRSLGSGLSARQNFRRQLEAAALNPRDPDPHYQLGLLYLHRRNLPEAEASFRRALEVQPKDAETLFQLGKMLRNQPGRSKEALELLERAVQIDPALANYEVWRELGALALEAGRVDIAVPQLEHYVTFREYDPEGLVLLGQALRTANREPDAKAAFEKAIVAVKTAPSFRRHALKRWESQARQELKR